MQNYTTEHQPCINMHEHDLIFDQFRAFIMHCITSFYRSIGKNCPYHEREDIFQDVALKILKNDYTKKYDQSKGAVTTWLGMIIRTSIIDRLRKRQLDFLSIEQDIESFEPSLESQIEPLSLPDGVLTPRQVEILELTFLDELEANDIAVKLGISPCTARSLKFQALERLREYFSLDHKSEERRIHS